MKEKFYKENCFVNMPKHMVEQPSLQILHHYKREVLSKAKCDGESRFDYHYSAHNSS